MQLNVSVGGNFVSLLAVAETRRLCLFPREHQCATARDKSCESDGHLKSCALQWSGDTLVSNRDITDYRSGIYKVCTLIFTVKGIGFVLGPVNFLLIYQEK